jgi:Ca-activated chloride channel family protein
MQKASKDPGFKWSHPSTATASGLLATTAEFYAGAGRKTNLTKKDLEAERTIEYVKTIEATVERYGGESEDRVAIRMLAEGGHPLDAFVAQEQLVIYFNRNTLGEKLVAIYPKEGTFWMDHPLVLMEGPWVTEEQKRTFREFAAFVRKPEQQQLVLREGYRPAEVAVSLQAEGSLIRPEYNVDPKQPKTLLKVPPAGVVEIIRELWRLTKKPANIYLVVDVSGSMQGEKLYGAKDALLSFIDQIEGDRDRVALVSFSSDVNEIQRLGQLDREHFGASIRGLTAGGGTMLYDAVAHAFWKLKQQHDPQRINVIVAMTDGQSQGDIGYLELSVREADFPVLIFTVAYGEDADLDVLKRIARMGDGQAYPSDPETIEKLYQLLSAFF